jgi:hypothetical protein
MIQPTGVLAWMPLVGCNIPKPAHYPCSVGLVEVWVDSENGKTEFRLTNPWPEASNEIDPDIPPGKPNSKNIYKPVVNTKRRVIK